MEAWEGDSLVLLLGQRVGTAYGYHVIGSRYFLRNRDRIARKHLGF